MTKKSVSLQAPYPVAADVRHGAQREELKGLGLLPHRCLRRVRPIVRPQRIAVPPGRGAAPLPDVEAAVEEASDEGGLSRGRG